MADNGVSRRAWLEQKHRAHNRSIPFLFTFEEWRDWWLAELAKHGAGARRGLGHGGLVMCRHGDEGPYASGNVYAATQNDNTREHHAIGHGAKAVAALAAYGAEHGYWLSGRTGALHPRSKGVQTPDGAFPSITAAAAHYGISRTELRRRMMKWVIV